MSSMKCADYKDGLEQFGFTSRVAMEDPASWRIKGSLTETLKLNQECSDGLIGAFETPFSNNLVEAF